MEGVHERLEQREWYAVYSKPHKEEFAQWNFQLKGLEVFFPRLLLPESSKKRNRIVPLFPNYLFVRINFSSEYHYVIWTPGVRRIVTFDGAATHLDEKIIGFLMHQANPSGLISARSNLRIGQEIQINGGPFEGLVGIIQEPLNARGRVKVLMNLLSREVQVEVPIQLVKSEWVA
jgi:transcription elongation factor/antiterminator RfaH